MEESGLLASFLLGRDLAVSTCLVTILRLTNTVVPIWMDPPSNPELFQSKGADSVDFD